MQINGQLRWANSFTPYSLVYGLVSDASALVVAVCEDMTNEGVDGFSALVLNRFAGVSYVLAIVRHEGEFVAAIAEENTPDAKTLVDMLSDDPETYYTDLRGMAREVSAQLGMN